jgi:uncharacterized membrane protein
MLHILAIFSLGAAIAVFGFLAYECLKDTVGDVRPNAKYGRITTMTGAVVFGFVFVGQACAFYLIYVQ